MDAQFEVDIDGDLGSVTLSPDGRYAACLLVLGYPGINLVRWAVVKLRSMAVMPAKNVASHSRPPTSCCFCCGSSSI